MVYMGNLQVANMSKSAQGNAEQHDKNVKQNSRLNRAILNQLWFEFRRQLDCKVLWRGGYLVAVPLQNTSCCCPACDHTAKDNRQTQANVEWVAGGYQNNANVVGAINMLKRGREILAAQQ